jgi:AhpD family alkylhydroperoxidase
MEQQLAGAESAVRLVEAQDAPLLARPYFADGPPSPITRSLAHVPELLESTLSFIGAALGPSALDERTKEIVILRASAVMECRYCVATHSVVALDSGLSTREVAALRGEQEVRSAFADERDRALIAWTDAVAAGRGVIDDACLDALREHVDEPAVVELTLVAATTLMLNRYASALRLPAAQATLARLREEGLA